MAGQLAPADILDLLLRLRSGVEKLLQARLYVVDFAVADRTVNSPVVAIGVQTDLLVTNPEANVIRLIRIGLHTQEAAIRRLGSGQVPDGIGDVMVTYLLSAGVA